MNQNAVQPHINLETFSQAVLLERVVHPEDKVCQLKKLINWRYLEKELGYLFQGDHAPSPRLIFGLLYLQSIDDLPYSDVISIWKKSPEWQYFCGEKYLSETFPLHDAALSIWSRVIGTQGRELMMRALGSTLNHRETVH